MSGQTSKVHQHVSDQGIGLPIQQSKSGLPISVPSNQRMQYNVPTVDASSYPLQNSNPGGLVPQQSSFNGQGHVGQTGPPQRKIPQGYNQQVPISAPVMMSNAVISNGRISKQETRIPPYPEPPRYPGPPCRTDSDGTKISSSQLKQYPGQIDCVTEEDLCRVGRGELIRRTLMSEGELREMKQKCLGHSGEARHLRDQIQRLIDDNQELRDLCCFLDDDRQKGRKFAREWQRFGRYTASVMRQEVTAYQNKLRELDAKQQELIKDNLELKELCLYLDEERNNATCSHCGRPLIARDDGDGSSSSTNADEGAVHPSVTSVLPSENSNELNSHLPCLARPSSWERVLDGSNSQQRSPFNEQILSYIRSLEAKVMLLETEKQQLSEELLKRVERSVPEGENGPNSTYKNEGSRNLGPPPYSYAHRLRAVGLGIDGRSSVGIVESDDEVLDGPPLTPAVSRPAAVAAAMRVLEVQEQLDVGEAESGLIGHSASSQSSTLLPPVASPVPVYSNGSSGNTSEAASDAALADGEKALLRQMCNVVWRKLEEIPNQHR